MAPTSHFEPRLTHRGGTTIRPPLQFSYLRKSDRLSYPFEPLIGALKNEVSEVRWAAAWALASIGSPAVEPLIGALKDESSDVRLAAARALGEIKDPSSVEPLIGALKDEYWLVRGEAACSLGKIKDPIAVPQLIEALKDEDEAAGTYVRRAAAKALGEIGDKSAITPLKAQLPFLGIFGGLKIRDVRAEIKAAIKKLEGN